MEWAAQLVDEISRFFATYHATIIGLGVAAALGAVIGLEREASAKPAGFRTNLLICVGAALLTQLSAAVAGGADGGVARGDPGRIAAQIVSGIGFLGAGTILQARGSVIGLTTAATMWVVAAIGIAVGTGAYVEALMATALVILALRLLGRVEEHVIARIERERTIRIVLDARVELVAGIEQELIASGYQVRSVDVEKHEDTLVASFAARGSTAERERALRALLAREGVRQVTLT